MIAVEKPVSALKDLPQRHRGHRDRRKRDREIER